MSRLQLATHCKNQDELAELLKVARSTLNGWGTRDSIPYEKCVEVAERYPTSLDWLLLGREQSTDSTRMEALKAENAQLRAENQRLRRETAEADGQSDGSDVDALLRIAEFVGINGPVTELQLQESLGMAAEDVSRLCLILFRRRVLKQMAAGWSLQKEGVFRVDETGEVADLGKQALKLMEERVVFGARGHRGALAVADVRIAGDEPGERVMTAIREALLRIEDQEGRIQKVVVGVTPALDEDEK